MKRIPFQIGANLGGWLSQYPAFTREHFDSFISPSDIAQIASWGMDHVRLPVDYPVLESDDKPFSYREEGWAYLDKALEWCGANKLGVILDLHRASGFAFQAWDSAALFRDPVLQERFIQLWQAIAQRYDGIGDTLAFELLNEIVLRDSTPWNALARRALAAIRVFDADRPIVVGGNYYNSVAGLKELDIPADPYLIYTFHYYEPMPFTHQKAPWVPLLATYGQTVDYPGELPNLAEVAKGHPEYQQFISILPTGLADRDLLLRLLQPALDFRAQTGHPLYCGEYGVIDCAPRDSSVRWHQDFVSLLREHNIARAVWSYKQMDFGLVDANGRVVDEELVRVVAAR